MGLTVSLDNAAALDTKAAMDQRPIILLEGFGHD
jgi:hypothetical protein